MNTFQVYVSELNTFFTAYRKEIELFNDNVLVYGFNKDEFMGWFERSYPNIELSAENKELDCDWFYANMALKNYALLVYGDWLNKFQCIKEAFVPEYYLPMSQYNELKKQQNVGFAGVEDEEPSETRPIR